MYEQIAIFQNCFSSPESTFCTTENTFILQSTWPKVYEGGNVKEAQWMSSPSNHTEVHHLLQDNL